VKHNNSYLQHTLKYLGGAETIVENHIIGVNIGRDGTQQERHRPSPIILESRRSISWVRPKQLRTGKKTDMFAIADIISVCLKSRGEVEICTENA
jgi:hypothetical protein